MPTLIIHLAERVRGSLVHPLRPAVVAVPRGTVQGGTKMSGLLAFGRLCDGGVQEGGEHGSAGGGMRRPDNRKRFLQPVCKEIAPVDRSESTFYINWISKVENNQNHLNKY